MQRRYRTLCSRFRKVSAHGEGREERDGNVVSSRCVYLVRSCHDGRRTDKGKSRLDESRTRKGKEGELIRGRK